MKNIVLCPDGTGNNDVKARGTNVFKLYEAIDRNGHKSDPTLVPQVAFYDDGVGTSKFIPLRLLGGALGWGFSQNVNDLYTELAHAYELGDKIFLFGFSRGAYRVVAIQDLNRQSIAWRLGLESLANGCRGGPELGFDQRSFLP